MSSRATNYSYVTLPKSFNYSSVLDFFTASFPRISREVWIQRMQNGLVSDDNGNQISPLAPFLPGVRLRYFREVKDEPKVPFEEEIIYCDENILVVDKPHFLPVIPSGPYVNECLLERLRKKTGNNNIAPINRIDKETAGLVLFSVNPHTRGKYGRLFEKKQVRKIYEAVAQVPTGLCRREWVVETRIEKAEPWFRSANVEGEPNSKSFIWLLDMKEECGYFLIEPVTGKNHQIRLHMCAIGCPIKNDFLYPILSSEPKKEYDIPLQLVSRTLEFVDPVANEKMRFVSKRKLEWSLDDKKK